MCILNIKNYRLIQCNSTFVDNLQVTDNILEIRVQHFKETIKYLISIIILNKLTIFRKLGSLRNEVFSKFYT